MENKQADYVKVLFDILAFKTTITPLIVQVFFWFGVAGCIFNGFYLILSNQINAGFWVLFLGPFALRIFCEFLLVFIGLKESLDKLGNSRNPD